MVGKFGISAAFSSIYLVSAELFPTVMHNFGMGCSSSAVSIGSCVSLYIALACGLNPLSWPCITLWVECSVATPHCLWVDSSIVTLHYLVGWILYCGPTLSFGLNYLSWPYISFWVEFSRGPTLACGLNLYRGPKLAFGLNLLSWLFISLRVEYSHVALQ